MNTLAVVFEEPRRLALNRVELNQAAEEDVVVDIEWSGISTGTERLLWTGDMPQFPGMGYPLVPGYESVGRVTEAGPESGRQAGDRVFVPGSTCFSGVRGLFGGAAARVVVPGKRVLPIRAHLNESMQESTGEESVLLALAATAFHALNSTGQSSLPDLIVGHGVLGRMLARLTVARGGSPTVWEQNPARSEGATGYAVVNPEDDSRKDYQTIYDVSGDANLLDTLISRLARNGEIVLAGFYSERLSFNFPPAFMREASIRIASEWQPADLAEVAKLIDSKVLSLEGLITHRENATQAASAYEMAFTDPSCLKMVLDWRGCS